MLDIDVFAKLAHPFPRLKLARCVSRGTVSVDIDGDLLNAWFKGPVEALRIAKPFKYDFECL